MRSALGRNIDILVPSNVYVIFAAVVAGAIGLVIGLAQDADGAIGVIGTGIGAGGAAFLAWAIARELDPDNTLTATLGPPLGLAGWFFDAPGLLLTGAALLTVRVVARTTGSSPAPVDLVFIVGFCAVAGLRPGGVIGAGALGLAVIVDSILTRSVAATRYLAGLGAIVAAGLVALVQSDPMSFQRMNGLAVAITAAAVIGAFVTPLPEVLSVGDLTMEPVERNRVRLARWTAAGIVIAYAGVGGTTGITIVGPLVAALISLPVTALVRKGQTRSGRAIRTSTLGE
ncbi:MAG: hypothetical protein OES13_02480 [Acidimicrobiia bacterium]|nr:hypothetical protein [Acidimicrobiia bacterium]